MLTLSLNIFLIRYLFIMFVGSFSPAIFFKVSSVFLACTITVIYFIAQRLGQEPPLSWISGCAQHYPEFILFRLATISGAVFILLGWMTNTFYLRTVAKEKGFHIQRYQPQIPMVLGMMGALFITVSTATLDTGERKGKLHVHCASGFFICTYFAILYNTAIYWVTQNKTRALNGRLLIWKTVIAGILAAMTIYNSFSVGPDGLKSTKGIILEWSASYTVAAYFFVMSKDVEPLAF